MIVVLILLCSIAVLIVVWIHIKWKSNELYWNKRGVALHGKFKVGGPLLQYIIGNKPLFEIFRDIYHKYEDEPAVGLGAFTSPILYIKDPVNIQYVLHTEFQRFNHRGFEINETDVLMNNIVFTHGPKWKLLRQKLTPLFTAAKIKKAFSVMDRSALDFMAYLKRNPEKLKKDTHSTLMHFCTAAFAASVFGIGTHSSFESPYQKMVKAALEPNIRKNLIFSIAALCDCLYKTLELKLFGDHEHFFIDAIKQVIRKRELDNTVQDDFVGLCVSLQKRGTMRDHDTCFELEPTDELMAAQAFFFFLAGVQPSSTVFFALIVELGRNPSIQHRVIKEIDAVFQKYNGQIDCDAIFEMEYLRKVLDETLRMYPPIAYVTRKCVSDSVLPVGNIPVERGTKIFLPIYELHHDPKYFPKPEVFDPDRFCQENLSVYMPFGTGKRICIALRYARLQLLSGVVRLLRNYTLKTVIYEGGIKYRKEQFQVRLTNVDVEFVPRD